MNGSAPPVQVHLDRDGRSDFVGNVYVSERRRTVSTTFTYDSSFAARANSYSISPDLDLQWALSHHLSGLPGAFADAAPDRWGRHLIVRQLRGQAALDHRPAQTIVELDYLLGVSDLTRQGALRFRREPEPEYLASGTDVPPLVELPRLLRAADAVSAGDDTLAPVKALLDAGTGSLGGARPKASVRDGPRLLIAKFPHREDHWNVMAWEMTVLDLAERAGIATPTRRLVRVGERPALLVERFDRSGSVRRAYISAMTLVSGTDGEAYDYLEVAEKLAEHGAAVTADLHRLWRRIAFFLAVNNTDDHLRNHGFLRAPGGWTLSPAFDVNPNPDPSAPHATSIGYRAGRSAGLDALMGLVADFGLDSSAARRILAEIADAVSQWRQVAAGHGISHAEQALFADVFDEWSAP